MREAPRSRLGTLHPLWRQDAPYAGAAARGQAVDLSRLSSVQVEALAKAGFIDPVMRDSKAEVAEGVGRLLNWPPDRQGLNADCERRGCEARIAQLPRVDRL